MRPAKNVLFHYTMLNVGGAELSVVRLMKLLVDRGWQVELVLDTGGGALESEIDPRVKVTHLRDLVVGRRFFEERVLHKKLLWAILDFVPFLVTRAQWYGRALQYLFRRYDVAVISLQGLSPSFCCRWVRANARFQWIRNDLRFCDPDGKAKRFFRRFAGRIDRFVCVSGTSRDSLVDLFPEFEGRSIVLYNVLNAGDMISRALESDPYSQYLNILKVVTVCRLSDRHKGLFRMLGIHNQLREMGFDFYWFVIGGGPDFDSLSKAVSDSGMGDRFILLGERANPFPYYRHADIAATLSFYEGLCGAVSEAKVMGKPVIATRFSGIDEQLIDGVNGLVVENNEAAIREGMQALLKDEMMRCRLSNEILPDCIRDDNLKFDSFDGLVEEYRG